MTLKTIKPGGLGDYPTLTLWLASRSATLTAPEQADVYNFGPGGLVEDVAINGFTTTSTNRFNINVPPAERHNGTAHSGAYLTSSTGTTLRLGSGVDYLTIDGLEIESTDTSNGYAALHWEPGAASTSNELRVEHAIIHGKNPGGPVIGGSSTTNLKLIFRNTLMYCSVASRVLDVRGANNCEISACTIYTQAGDFALLGDSACTVTDTAIGGSSNKDMWNTFGILGSYNSTSDTTATTISPGTGGINSVSGATAYASVTALSEDFRTKTGFTTFNGAGTNIAAVTDDLVGVARANPPCIGAFENAAGNPTFSMGGTGAYLARMASAIAAAGTCAVSSKSAVLISSAGIGAFNPIPAGVFTFGMTGVGAFNAKSASRVLTAGVGAFNPIPYTSPTFSFSGAGAFNPQNGNMVRFSFTGAGSTSLLGSGWRQPAAAANIWTRIF